MDKKFCKAMVENDRASLKIIFDKKLETLDAKNDLEQRFKIIKAWIEKHECVTDVEVNPDLLDSDPPIKEMVITIKTSAGTTGKRGLGIQLLANKLLFDF